jgi:hypothetical protein
MDVFSPVPPEWTKSATHALEFCCPNCRASAREAELVWMNRRSPVMTEDYGRKWQEFYQCQCGRVWWAWSNDRPPSDLAKREQPPTS